FLPAQDGIRVVTVTGVQPSAVPHLVAQTATGGIFLSNTGDLALDYSGAPVHGVQVTGTSGDISLTTSGALTVPAAPAGVSATHRSEERRVGNECHASSVNDGTENVP